ncbi:MAG: hypothetical protein LBI06_08580 [Treponema sp.]|nr:hypothetical protein [Treponema sp.]
MENNRTIVIITDGAAPILELAGSIAAIIGNYPGYTASVIQADNFTGADLLPAHAFFLGCGQPKPPSFFCMEAFFGHINLAGRPCGIFASTARASKYLSVLISDCKSATGKPFMAKGGAADSGQLQKWVQGILKERK